MKCTKCGKRAGWGANRCQRCGKAEDAATKAQLERLTCKECGKFPARLGYYVRDSSDQITTVCCYECSEEEKVRQRSAFTTQNAARIELLREISEIAEQRGLRAFSNNDGKRLWLDIRYNTRSKGWQHQTREIAMTVMFEGDDLSAKVSGGYLRDWDEVFRLPASPDCAEHVANLVQTYMVSRNP